MVSPLFADHMVLQRDNPTVFGWAPPGFKITVTVKEPTVSGSATADSNGRWWVKLPNLDAGGPYVLQVVGPTTQTFTDVLAGEVWIWAGGSNAAMSLDDMLHDTDYDPNWRNLATVETLGAGNSSIRLLNFAPTGSYVPQAVTPPGAWQACDAAGASSLGAAAYLFAKQLQPTLRVPVGIIQLAVADSYIRQWLSAPALAQVPNLYVSDDVPPSILFNSMVSPLAGAGLAGVAWYQGEPDAAWRDLPRYESLLRALKGTWRQTIGSATLPFIVVQLANYGPIQGVPVEPPIDLPVPKGDPPLVENRMVLREAQRAATADDPFAQLIATVDVGDPNTLLPPNKWDVAARWVAAVMGGIFQSGGESQGPAVSSYVLQNGSVVLSMAHTGNGLLVASKHGMAAPSPTPGTALGGFAIGDANGNYVWALAQIQGTQVVIQSPAVPVPSFVRYSWGANPVGNLYNGAGLPAPPFSLNVVP